MQKVESDHGECDICILNLETKKNNQKVYVMDTKTF